jgi:gluconolactonase
MGSSSAGRSVRDYGPLAPPQRYPDPDIVTLDARFALLRQGNTAIQRLWTGGLWCEGPAWSAGGRYLVWSDIPNNRQLRWLDEDGHVSLIRQPAGNSNGNTFDYQGRQIACEHLHRRVVRYEHDGSTTVLAERYEGKRLNSPNDVVVHPDGAIWFTDPPYGTRAVGAYEGAYGSLELPHAVYRIEVDGSIARVSDELDTPNGLCFSHDYRRLYIVDTGEPGDIRCFDVIDGRRLTNHRQLTDMRLNGVKIGPDGIRVDSDGNIWAAAGWAGPDYDGVIVLAPDGTPIGQIRLPETCANLCFGGPKRNRLFMTASQSLYAVYLNTRGGHIC